MREARELRQALDARRLETKRPLLDLERRIDAIAAGPIAALKALDSQASDKLRVWEMAEQRRREEEERARQAELRRIEAERIRLENERLAREAAERKRQAAETERKRLEAEQAAAAAQATEEPPFFSGDEAPLPATPPAIDDTMDMLADQNNADQEAELARKQAELEARPVAIARPSGITYRETLKFTVLNVAALPAKYVIRTVDEAAIRRDFCVGFNARQPLPVLPGVQFHVHKDPIQTRR
jgi:hypothetical protein